MMWSKEFIEKRVQYWKNVLEDPQYYADEEVAVAADRLWWWQDQLDKKIQSDRQGN